MAIKTCETALFIHKWNSLCDTFVPNGLSYGLVFSPQDERAATAETGKGNAKKLLRNEEQIEEIETHPDTKSSGKHNMPQIV